MMNTMSFSGLTPHFISPSCSAQPSPLASLYVFTSLEPPLRTTHAETTHTDVSASADAVAPHTAASLDDAALHTIRALVFDLDGTLLDTLPHLTALTNFVLAQQHFSQHTQEEVLSYIGEGGQKLLMRAAPENTPQDVIDAMFQQWKEKFYTHGIDLVAPFEGINDMLATLKTRALLGVLSNKFDAAALQVCSSIFLIRFVGFMVNVQEFRENPNQMVYRIVWMNCSYILMRQSMWAILLPILMLLAVLACAQ